MIFNIFCDASIDTTNKIACGGCSIYVQDDYGVLPFSKQAIIQLNATNNSAEILAIWVGVSQALLIRRDYPSAIFRLFSDSKISLYGLRDWMKSWISNIKPGDPEKILISSSNTPVMNQQRFIDIFNIIVENNLRIEFYHQRGHVGEYGKVNLIKARASFIKANKVAPESLGLDIDYLSKCNSDIDKYTREAIYKYEKLGEFLPGVAVEAYDPIFHIIRDSMLHQYIRCIDKTTVKSYHDFKGGYNQ